MLQGCSEPCDCTYVQYEKAPNSYEWKEVYTSNWDVHSYCDEGNLDESTYIDFEGKKWESKTDIECR